MRFKATLKLDLTYVDDKYSGLRKHARENPLGKAIYVEGSLEEIKKNINKRIDELGEMLEKWNQGKEEEINV